jgi:hypothetical protein
MTNQTNIANVSLASIVAEIAGHVPQSNSTLSAQPQVDALKLANVAARNAAFTAGSLSLPPGPVGWLTLIPELVAVWKIQAQMVSDIAAVFGQTASLGSEQMLYCLLRHTAAQAVRDLVVRVGERLLVKRATVQVIQRIAAAIGIKVAQRTLGKALSRWVPVLGAVGVGGYAYYDTNQVAKAALELFSSELQPQASEPIPVT